MGCEQRPTKSAETCNSLLVEQKRAIAKAQSRVLMRVGDDSTAGGATSSEARSMQASGLTEAAVAAATR